MTEEIEYKKLFNKEKALRKEAQKLLKIKSEKLNEISNTLEQKIKDKEYLEKLLLKQSKMAALGEMIGMISHQWRQPLNSVGVLLQEIFFTLKMNNAEKLVNPDLKEEIMEQLDYMAHTIDDFKNFFKENKNTSDTNILKEVASILKIVSASLISHNIKICCRAEGQDECGFDLDDILKDENIVDKYFVVTYPNELKQVIINIINNSKDALIEKTTENDKRFIKIRIDKTNNNFEISIEDNAGGIHDKQKLKKIWDPYYTTKDEGTGIGLYMSKIIVEKNLKGSIESFNGEYGLKTVIKLPNNI